MRKSREESRESKPLTTKVTKITKERQRKSSRLKKNLTDSSAEEKGKQKHPLPSFRNARQPHFSAVAGMKMWLRRSEDQDPRLRTEGLRFESSRGYHDRIAYFVLLLGKYLIEQCCQPVTAPGDPLADRVQRLLVVLAAG